MHNYNRSDSVRDWSPVPKTRSLSASAAVLSFAVCAVAASASAAGQDQPADTGDANEANGSADEVVSTLAPARLVGTSGALRSDRRIAWSAGVPGGIPDWDVSVSVTDYGAVAGDGRDDSDAFQAAIDDAPTETAVRVPAGSYNLNDQIRMRSGIALRGDDADSTELEVSHGQEAIVFEGGRLGTQVRATGGLEKGSSSLSVSDTSQFGAGGYAVLRQRNDAGLMYTQERWNVGFARDTVGQVVRIASVNGDSVQLEQSLNLDFSPGLDPQLQPVSMITRSGLESLHIRRDDSSPTYAIEIKHGAGIWVENVHSERAAKAHIYFERSYRCEIRGSFFDDASNHGIGGFGYGVWPAEQTTGVLVEDNIFQRLRHSMTVSLGANGNVFGYNYSREPITAEGFFPPDINVHGHYPFANLFEGNVVQSVVASDFWGPAGPDNTFLRNRVESLDLDVKDNSDRQNFIGNVILSGRIDIGSSVDEQSLLIHRNRATGTVGPDSDGGGGAPVNSYYRTGTPGFYRDLGWPSIGPAINEGTNPAKTRYDQGDFIR